MKLQCAGTLSDMQAFKAANPGAPFEYFLRWFSPSDVQFAADRCPPGRLLYQLSPRMQLPGTSHIHTSTVPFRPSPPLSCFLSLRHATPLDDTHPLDVHLFVPDNMWNELWESAEALPVSRQKRLFDEGAEAEKVLHWLDNVQLDQLLLVHLLPSFTQLTLSRLARSGIRVLYTSILLLFSIQ